MTSLAALTTICVQSCSRPTNDDVMRIINVFKPTLQIFLRTWTVSEHTYWPCKVCSNVSRSVCVRGVLILKKRTTHDI